MKDIDLFIQGKTYAKAIRDKKIKIMDLLSVNKSHLATMTQIQGELLTDINSELGENNKKVYSNETLRQTELRKRLGKDAGYLEAKIVVEINNSKIDEFQIGLEFSRNMLDLLIAFLR